jgi:hypothetical protein
LQQVPGESDTELQQAMAASRLQSSPTAPTVGTTGGPQPAAKTAQTTTPPASGGTDFSLNPSDYSRGGTAFGDRGSSAGTVGGLIHTGGVQELDLQKEMLAMRLNKQGQQERVAAAQAKAADAAAKAAGTGQYAVQAALNRAKLEKAQLDLQKAKNPTADKNAPPVNISEQPVTDQNQLNKFVDGNHGNGTMAGLVNSVANPMKDPSVDEKGNQTQIVTIPISKNKTITMPLEEAQRYIKQQNYLRLKNRLPPLRVPGENPEVGKTKDNPYVTKYDLDVASRPVGSWVTLPDGTLAQVPEPERKR